MAGNVCGLFDERGGERREIGGAGLGVRGCGRRVREGGGADAFPRKRAGVVLSNQGHLIVLEFALLGLSSLVSRLKCDLRH